MCISWFQDSLWKNKGLMNGIWLNWILKTVSVSLSKQNVWHSTFMHHPLLRVCNQFCYHANKNPNRVLLWCGPSLKVDSGSTFEETLSDKGAARLQIGCQFDPTNTETPETSWSWIFCWVSEKFEKVQIHLAFTALPTSVAAEGAPPPLELLREGRSKHHTAKEYARVEGEKERRTEAGKEDDARPEPQGMSWERGQTEGWWRERRERSRRVDMIEMSSRGDDGGEGGGVRWERRRGGMREVEQKPHGASSRYLRHPTPSLPGQLGRAGGPNRSAH